MLTRPLFEKIRRKLERRENLFRIAAETGVPHPVLCAMVDGWRPTFRRGRPRKHSKENLPSYDKVPDVPQATTLSRCPECGGWVYLPCRKCALEKLPRTARKGLQISEEVPEEAPLEVRLGPQCYARYLRIREQKIREELEQNSRENADEWKNLGLKKGGKRDE